MAVKLQTGFFGIEITGTERISSDLINTSNARNRIAITKAIRAGGNIVVREARRTVSVRTGQLKKSLGIKIKVFDNSNAVAIIGPRVGFKVIIDGRPINPTRYAHLVEQHKPFLRPALHKTRKEVLSVMQSVYTAEINR